MGGKCILLRPHRWFKMCEKPLHAWPSIHALNTLQFSLATKDWHWGDARGCKDVSTMASHIRVALCAGLRPAGMLLQGSPDVASLLCPKTCTSDILFCSQP